MLNSGNPNPDPATQVIHREGLCDVAHDASPKRSVFLSLMCPDEYLPKMKSLQLESFYVVLSLAPEMSLIHLLPRGLYVREVHLFIHDLRRVSL